MYMSKIRTGPSGPCFGSEITRRCPEGMEDDTYQIHCTGTGGQSFGAFIPKGLTIDASGRQQ